MKGQNHENFCSICCSPVEFFSVLFRECFNISWQENCLDAIYFIASLVVYWKTIDKLFQNFNCRKILTVNSFCFSCFCTEYYKATNPLFSIVPFDDIVLQYLVTDAISIQVHFPSYIIKYKYIKHSRFLRFCEEFSTVIGDKYNFLISIWIWCPWNSLFI